MGTAPAAAINLAGRRHRTLAPSSCRRLPARFHRSGRARRITSADGLQRPRFLPCVGQVHQRGHDRAEAGVLQAFNRFSYVGNSSLGIFDLDGNARGPREIRSLPRTLLPTTPTACGATDSMLGMNSKCHVDRRPTSFLPSGRWTVQTPTFNRDTCASLARFVGVGWSGRTQDAWDNTGCRAVVSIQHDHPKG